MVIRIRQTALIVALILCAGLAMSAFPAAAFAGHPHPPVELGLEPIPQGGVDLKQGLKLQSVSGGNTPLPSGSEDEASDTTRASPAPADNLTQEQTADEK